MSDNEALLSVVGILAVSGVSMTIRYDGKTLSAFFEDGFYKSDGMAYLKPEDGLLYLFARYGEKTQINSLADVVNVSKSWHDYSRDRFDGWASPPANWAKLYAQYCS